MRVEQLIHILEVYKTGTLSEAAKKCHISLPGMSQSIKNSEKELDMKIFNRSYSGIIPTENGIKVINSSSNIIAEFEKLKELSSPKNLLLNTKISVSASPSLMFLLLKFTKSFKDKYPQANIEITERTALEVVEAVKTQNIDFGLTAINSKVLGENENKLECSVLLKAIRYICVNKNSSLATYSTISPEMLINEQLVIYNGISLKSFIDDFLKDNKRVNILFESNQLEIIKRTVANGLAITLLNNLLLEDDPYVSNGNIILIPLDKNYQDYIDFGIVESKKSHVPYAVKEFKKHIKNIIKTENL